MEELRPYFQAIAKIRQVLEPLSEEIAGSSSGFKAWPNPNQFHDRTPKYILLVTENFSKGDFVSYLTTPFGQVQLYSSGFLKPLFDIKKQFAALGTNQLPLKTGQIGVSCAPNYFPEFLAVNTSLSKLVVNIKPTCFTTHCTPFYPSLPKFHPSRVQ